MVTYVEASWRAVVATSLFCAVVIAGLLVARRRGRYRATKNDVGVEARRLFNANSVTFVLLDFPGPHDDSFPLFSSLRFLSASRALRVATLQNKIMNILWIYSYFEGIFSL